MKKCVFLFVILTTMAGCQVNKPVDWTPEMFRLECVDGDLWAYNGLGERALLSSDAVECEGAKNGK